MQSIILHNGRLTVAENQFSQEMKQQTSILQPCQESETLFPSQFGDQHH